jgi:protease-4
MSIERMKQTFVGLVMDERGSNLTVDRQRVSRAKVYTGTRAVELGFADEVGGRNAAIADAAQRAGVDDYRVTTISSSRPSSISLLAAENVDTTRYFALHGLPDSAAVTPLEAFAANDTSSTIDTNAVVVGGDAR